MTSENNLDSWLDKESFRHIVASTPLISIDLVVRNEVGQVLLGQRLNRPAQGYWFVPGGRVRKDECRNQSGYYSWGAGFGDCPDQGRCPGGG